MSMFALPLLLVGGILSLVGGIWFLVVAFKKSLLWGLGVIFIPFMGLVFLVLHWRAAGRPFGLSLLGIVLVGVGRMLATC